MVNRACLQVLAALLILSGCTPVKRTWQPEQHHDAMDNLAFVHYLSGLPMVTADEAYHAMLLLADGEDTGGSFEARERILVDRGIAREAWGLGPDDALDRGTLAFMISRILKLRGGINDLAFGSWGLGDRRYALRTGVWQEVIPYGPAHQIITGGELLTVMTNAEAYMEREGMIPDSSAPEATS